LPGSKARNSTACLAPLIRSNTLFMSFGVSLGGLTSLRWVFGENITSTVTPLPRLIGSAIEPSLFLWVKLRSAGDCNFFSSPPAASTSAFSAFQ
jgi:hypothetical protein